MQTLNDTDESHSGQTLLVPIVVTKRWLVFMSLGGVVHLHLLDLLF